MSIKSAESEPHGCHTEEINSISELISEPIMQLIEDVTAFDDDLDALINTWVDAKTAIKMLSELIDTVENIAVDLIPWETGPRGGRRPSTVPIEGVGSFTVSRPAQKTVWDESTMREALKRAIELGQVNRPEDAADFVMSILYAGTQFKRSELSALGLDPDELSERNFGRRRLRML